VRTVPGCSELGGLDTVKWPVHAESLARCGEASARPETVIRSIPIKTAVGHHAYHCTTTGDQQVSCQSKM
jgi:hypothetical protein